MKKLLSLMGITTLTATSVMSITAFKTANKEKPNVNFGTADDYSLHLTIQMNWTAWNHLLKYKQHFFNADEYGFGAYLFEYADDNDFGAFWMPDVPNAVAFYKNNIIEKCFGDFGGWLDPVSKVAKFITLPWKSYWNNCFWNKFNSATFDNIEFSLYYSYKTNISTGKMDYFLK